MPRTLPGDLGTEIEQVTTRPGYLIYLGGSLGFRYATRSTITWNSFLWTASGAEVVEVSPESCRISLRNTDNSASAVFLNTYLVNIPVEVYVIYDTDAVMIHAGFLDGAEFGRDRIMLSSKMDVERLAVPYLRIAPPLFNHLIPANVTIQWGIDKILLERG